MDNGTRIAVFAAGAAAVAGTAYGVGTVLTPAFEEPRPACQEQHAGGAEAGDKGNGGHGKEAAGCPQDTQGGYALVLKTPRLEADQKEKLRFTVRRADGPPLTDFRREHGKDLHLIVVSRDLGTYRHLHPEMSSDGTWSVPVELPRAGGYRVFADFVPGVAGATGLTLGADLTVSGRHEARELPEESVTARVDDYTVTLDGELVAGQPEVLRLTVKKDGKPVRDLQPYLGAYGHLVALRSDDLAYLHVHPHGEPGDGSTAPGPDISFTATAPSTAVYRLFLDFRHEGEVRTAMFTLTAAEEAGGAEPQEPSGDGAAADSHQH